MRATPVLVVAAALAGLLPAGCSTWRPDGREPTANVERGRLLYDTACVACHNEQIHWRDKSAVASWDQLLYQVNRWQNTAGQGWSEIEIRDVGAYLNGRFYHLPCPGDGCAGPSG